MKIITRNNSRNAFTLIELLIGAGFVILFFGITLASSRGFGKKLQLEAEKDRFINTLELAKKKARVGDRGGCTTLSNYQISILNDQSYSLNPICTSGSGNSQTFTLKQSSSIRITDYTIQNTTFQPLTQSVSPNCIIISDTSTDRCYKLTIIESGITNDENQAGSFCTCN